MVTVFSQWLQDGTNMVFIIMAYINNRDTVIKAVLSGIQTQTLQQHAVVAEYSANSAVMLPILLRQRREVTRIQRYYEDVVPRYMPDEFRSHFRLSRETFQRLSEKIADCPTFQTFTGPTLDHTRDLLMFLWYIGNLESFKSMADRFGVAKSTYHFSVKKNASALVSDIMPNVIQWPTGDKIRETSDTLSELAGMLNVIGALDGCHIPIKAPKNNPNAYYNRKKFHSLVLLAACNSNLRFTYVWTGNPSSTHDATVLRSSELFQKSHDLCPEGYYLLGDSAFPLLGWLVTPFRDYGKEQRRFNVTHSKTRQVIERSFGLLKCRFRRLLRFDAYDMQFMVDTILAA